MSFRFVGGILLSLTLLAACQSGPTAQQTAYALHGKFNATLLGWVQYAEQPRCTPAVTTACHDPAAVKAGNALAHAAAGAIASLDKMTTATTPPPNWQEEVTNATTAVQKFTAFAASRRAASGG